MAKKILLFLSVLALVGCNYLDDPGLFIRDPHFTQYKESRDELELRYLHKEITYAEYVEEKSALDAAYDQEVEERNEKISPSE